MGLSFASPAWPVLAALVVVFILLDFQRTCEPLSFIELSGQSASAWLHTRLWLNLGLGTVALLIPSGLLMVFHPSLWWLAGLLILINAAIQAYAVCLKCSFWRQAADLGHRTILPFT